MPDFKLHEAFSEPGADLYKQKGNDAFKEGKWDEAIKNYNKAISLDPNQAPFYSNRAACWASKGNHESALADAKKCVERDPKFVKGYSRKGKALFDLGRLQEAEAAYEEGLAIDPSNEACKQGIVAVKADRKARSRTNSGFGNAGSFLKKAAEKMKSGGWGGRLQMYMVVMMGYYLYNQYVGNSRGRGNSKVSDSAHEAADEEGEGGYEAEARPMPEGGSWFSYLEAEGRPTDVQLLLLHRTAASAEAEYGALLANVLEKAPASGLKIFAPDRPCHGFSPCPESGEPSNSGGWLMQLLAKRRASKELAIVASGYEATVAALSLAQRRAAPVRLLVVSPQTMAPKKPAGTAKALGAWVDSHLTASSTARDVADAVLWASSPTGDGSVEDLETSVGQLPEGVVVTLLYGDKDQQDQKLKRTLEDLGAEVSVRQIRVDSLEELAAMVRRVLRASGADEEASEGETAEFSEL
eukprot:CAMPEP_0117551552 /NCGR_PEP_ID=MMETSP0784-20121206/49249_1 /TAXON_ID=39447 /ORGANISM="" /LENGTH=467 /DNA_ID=CAMNT_0005348593 /DNA_START=118 /DNA_END=1521 /DNA_ORIENTATION=-